jgi:nitrate/nitrite-specific signal transduction histidine kinase
MPEPTNQTEILQMMSEALERLQPSMDDGLETLLQAVVDYARKMVRASFAGIAILERNGSQPDGQPMIRYFKVSGWHAKFRELPKGHGMYLLPALTGNSMRVESVSGHPLSVGVPQGHPPVEALLTIPLKLHGHPIGCMFFGRPPKAGAFTKYDEDIMNSFASLCTMAISWCDQTDESRSRIVTQERMRIAEELHDSLSQTLFAVAREIDRLERILPTAEDKSELTARIERLKDLTQQCQAELRAILFRLMDDETKPNLSALNHLVQEFERVSGIPTQLISHGDFDQLSQPVRRTALKVITESLANVYRHSKSPVAVVHVLVDSSRATITVQDAGIGISDEALRFMNHPSGHFGLHSMAKSVASLKGRLEVFRNDDGGTTVRCTFPVHGDSVADDDGSAAEPNPVYLGLSEGRSSAEDTQGECSL